MEIWNKSHYKGESEDGAGDDDDSDGDKCV
jgi:hypothetical protein